MPFDPNFNFNFDPADQAAIHAALDDLLALLNKPTVPYVNLTKEERKAPSIGHTRLPYVHDAVDNILPVFPNLASPSIVLPRTVTLLQLIGLLMAIKPKLDELNDRFTDMGINAEVLVFKSMSDSYDTAKRQEGRMPGADVFIEAIAPLFANQGKKGSGPQPAPGDVNTGDNSTDPTPRPPSDGNGDATPSNS